MKKAELEARVRELEAQLAEANRKRGEDGERLRSHFQGRVHEARQDRAIDAEIHDRFRRRRMVRVIEEAATLRPGEMLILEAEAD